MHKFKIYDQVIIVDWWAQYTTPKEKDTIALTHFKRERSPIVIQWKATWKNYRIKWEIVKIIPEDDKYWVRLPDHGKHIVIGEYWLALVDQYVINNTTDLHGTYILTNNQTERNRALEFYKERGFTWYNPKVDVKYWPWCKYVCLTWPKFDSITYRLSYEGKCDPPKNCRDITHVIVWPGDPDQCSYEETYVRISCEEDYNTTVKFYEKKWFKRIDGGRRDRIRYMRTDHLWKRLHTWTERLLKENCSDLRDITHEVLHQTPTSFNLSPSTPMTNTLEQLKFDKYVKANQSKIVDLSDEIDNQLELANTVGKTIGDFYVRVKTINQSMSRAFESCNKELLDEAFTKLKDYDKLLKSEAFTTLTAAFKNFKSASDKLNSDA